MRKKDPGEAGEEAGAMRRAAALGITIERIGGLCPVQAEGRFDSKAFYFRARHHEWQFHVGPKGRHYVSHEWVDEWVIERDYEADAGRMSTHEAVGFICDGVEAFRARRSGEGHDVRRNDPARTVK